MFWKTGPRKSQKLFPLTKEKTYQAPTHWLKFYEEVVSESEARTAVVQLKIKA